MTGSPIRFGLTIPQRGCEFGILDVEQLLAMGVRADETPSLDSIWVGDSLTAKPRLDSITLLGALAGVTRRVTLGVACMASFPVRDPLAFAYQWASLDRISGGRTILAVCTGIVGDVSVSEGRHWGLTGDKERAPRMAENIEICRKLWSGESISFDGNYTSFEGLRILPDPKQDPCPIWISANPRAAYAERAMRRVAALADGWMSVELSPGMITNLWGMLRTYLTEGDRDPEAFPTMAYHNLNVNADRRAALEESQRFLDEYYGPVFSPEMTEAWTAAGSISECVADILRLVDGGAKQVTLRLTSWDQERQLTHLIEDVLPTVAEALKAQGQCIADGHSDIAVSRSLGT